MLREFRAEVVVALVGLLGYLPGLSAIRTTLDERIYATIAREMAANGHWLIPRYTGDADIIAGTVFLEKPPLVFWVQAVGVEALGETMVAVRLPTVLATVVLAVVVVRIGTRLYDRRTGFAAGLVFLAMPAMFWYGNGGRTATTDVILTLFGTLFVWFVRRAREDSRYLVHAGVAGGLAVMSKQLAAGVFLLIALPVLVPVLRDSDVAATVRGVAAGALVVLPWNLFALVSYPDRYVRQMLLEQAVGRVGTGHEPLHGRAVATVGPINPFYLLRFPAYLGPFFLSTVLGVALVAADLRRGATGPRRRAGLLCVWWLVLPVALFTVLTASTWIHYVMASVVPAAVLSGHVVSRAVRSVGETATRATRFGGLPYPAYLAAGAALTLAVLVLYPAHSNGLV